MFAKFKSFLVLIASHMLKCHAAKKGREMEMREGREGLHEVYVQPRRTGWQEGVRRTFR